MARPRIIYIHGAGPQEHRQIQKRRIDEALFHANQLDATVLAYYSDISHVEPDMPPPFEAVEPDAIALEAAFQARATEVAAAAAVAEGGATPGPFEGVTLPDPAFRIVASIASADVIAYLFGDIGTEIRSRVSAAIPAGEPLIVIAHSLGTIVAYDVLAERPELDVRLLITLGSPLGIGNVQRRLGDRSGPPAPIPACVAAWLNFADALDPVALELSLSDEFEPPNFVVDTIVENRALLNHDLVGYLVTDEVRGAVAGALEAPAGVGAGLER